MLICIPQVLSAEQVAFCRKVMDEAEWTDGKVTAGPQSGSVKNNLQLPENSPAAEQLGEIVLEAVSQSPLFISAALPHTIFPPLFNRYGEGNYFADAETLRTLEGEGRVAFRYSDQNGKVSPETCPNGAMANIAGIINDTGRVLGLMPHLERLYESALGGTDGRRVFESALVSVLEAA